MGEPIYEILTNGKEFIYDISPKGKPTFGDNFLKALQIRLGGASYFRKLAALSDEWKVKVINCK